jgi:hypothetical protein
MKKPARVDKTKRFAKTLVIFRRVNREGSVLLVEMATDGIEQKHD